MVAVTEALGFAFQKISKSDRHGPRSHINYVLPIKTTDQVPVEVVQIGIEDDGNPRPLFVVAKNEHSEMLCGMFPRGPSRGCDHCAAGRASRRIGSLLFLAAIRQCVPSLVREFT